MVARSDILLTKCAQFREQGEFIDICLKVSEDVFSAHRIVLAASSDYFHAMFANGMKESNQEVIELKDESISPAVLKIVLDSIYSGDLHVNDENIFEVLLAGDHLQVTSVVQQCCDYLQTEFVQLRFDVQTYCHICKIADRHGLKDLQEVTQCKMASMYKEICESEDFLSHIEADQFSTLLSRDDLSAPSETFVFKSVMQWIKHKKEERMPVAAKVIGAVRLGLVDIRDIIEELDTEEMKQLPEIFHLAYETLVHSHRPSLSSKFALEKARPRSMNQVITAVRPQNHMMYFDAEKKRWKPLSSLAPAAEALSCYCAQTIGRELFVAVLMQGYYRIYCYDLETNTWKKHQDPLACGAVSSLCTEGDYVYAIPSDCNQIPQRYSLTKRQWQSFAKVNNNLNIYCNGGTVLNSKLYVLYGQRLPAGSFGKAVLHCFDPVTNLWEAKASTCRPHFGSTLFLVNGKLYVARGRDAFNGTLVYGNPAPVEVYDQDNNKWSVVDQKHIPQNNLGAVEIEGRVYFFINRFPIDSGIRIPPEEVYPVCLSDWKNLGNFDANAALCYVPLKRECLQAD